MLGDDEGDTPALGIEPKNHPDQVYLRNIKQSVLNRLEGKTITRVEIDDSIQFCSTHPTQRCSVIFPEWCKRQFGDVPTFLFVHRSDHTMHNLGKKYAYDIRPNREGYYDQWEWEDMNSSTDFKYHPTIKALALALASYVMEFSCESLKYKKKQTYIVAVPNEKVTKQVIIDAKKKLGICTKCGSNPHWVYKEFSVNCYTRIAKANEKNVIT